MLEENFVFFVCFFVITLIYLIFKFLDKLYVKILKRPAWVHFYLFKKKISVSQRQNLSSNFNFYNRLSFRDRKRFEHRLCNFLLNKTFISRDGLNFTEDKKMLISATAVMLTFGMRDYMLPIIDKIIVYPDVFYSTINKQFHKGEFNPSLRALVLSWKDFEIGFKIDDDNLNLGIHEFTHAIHLNSINRTDVASLVFTDGFSELLNVFNDEVLIKEIKSTSFIRDYAFTNEFEFLAVILENFIESPSDFKNQLPFVYKKIQQMFNFRFAGY